MSNDKLKMSNALTPSPSPCGRGEIYRLSPFIKKLGEGLCILLLLAQVASAEEVLSKGEAIALISAADFVKQKIGDLFSWTIGYDISKVNRIKLVPSIKYIRAVPIRVPPDGRTVLEVSAAVEDPEGLPNISGVRADLTSIGKLSNTMLVDNGLWGDKVAGDGVYTLQSNVNPSIPLGSKEIPVAAANKKGWVALSKTSVTVDNTPQIIEADANPQKIKADGATPLKIIVKVDNPGGEDDLKGAYANLKDIGQGEKVALEYKGGQMFSLETVVPATAGSGRKKISIFAESIQNGIAQTDLSIEVIK